MAEKPTHKFVEQEWNHSSQESHNGLSSLDELVRILARKAAEDYFKAEQNRQENQDIQGN